MDVLEANTKAQQYTTHACVDACGSYTTSAPECKGNGSPSYVCDQNGCGLNPFRYGPGTTYNTGARGANTYLYAFSHSALTLALARIRILIFTPLLALARIRILTLTRSLTPNTRSYTHTLTHTDTCTRMHTQLRLFTHTHTHIHIYTRTQSHIHICIHIHTPTHSHSHWRPRDQQPGLVQCRLELRPRQLQTVQSGHTVSRRQRYSHQHHQVDSYPHSRSHSTSHLTRILPSPSTSP